MKLKKLTVGVIGSLAMNLVIASASQAQALQVAVAANMTAPMQKIAQAFEAQGGQELALSFGSTGKFYAQIRNGAPFAMLLAADQKTPSLLVKENLALADSQFTYALGTLVLWSLTPNLVDGQGEVLKAPTAAQLKGKLAIADPKLAPYGKAAWQTMEHLDVLERWQPHIIQGENIGQTYQFAATANATLGLVALSQVWSDGKLREGSAWIVPQSLYTPIAQDAVILEPGRDDPAAHALLKFLQSPVAQKILKSYGYRLPDPS